MLEPGKRYMTRDGRVTSPLRKVKAIIYPYAGQVEGENAHDAWRADGRYYNDEKDSGMDLIRELALDPVPSVIPLASRLDLVIAEVRSERAKQDEKWGEQNHEPHRWLSILMEEVGEAAQAANDSWDYRKSLAEQAHKQECYRQELVQVAAVTIAMIESLDRNGK